MNHHTIYCRLGGAELLPAELSTRTTVVSDIDFIDKSGELRFGLGPTLLQFEEMGLMPTEVAMDLILLATALTAADTRISRLTNSQNRWTREIDLHIPVSDPGLWQKQDGLLARMLRFLTGDHWRIFFRERPAQYVTLVRRPGRMCIVSPTTICLFSGGLDSFIGAIDLLCRGERPLLVSHRWDTLTSKTQRECISKLTQRFPGHVSGGHLSARIGFNHTTVRLSSVEDTQRGRSFLFFALATLAGSAIDGDVTIHVPENGLISLNVPLDPLRLGALSTRTTHPYYMCRFNELLERLGLASRLLNPYRHLTKGQMAERCLDRDFLRDYAALTMSCSGPAKYRLSHDKTKRKIQHCGHCVPCLIRRASLVHGFGDGEDATPYTIDVRNGRTLDSARSEGEHVRAFQLAIARMAANPDRARRDIHIPGPLSDHSDELSAYEAVYVEGMHEVGRLLDGVQVRALS